MDKARTPHPLQSILQNRRLILGSASPRRKELLEGLDLDFEIRTTQAEEHYPSHLKGREITEHLALLKARSFDALSPDEILITADTIVWANQKAVMKPGNKEEAADMMRKLSGKSHEVITSVCIFTNENHFVFSDITRVFFRTLEEDEIEYYLSKYTPYDKAGSYGIQEWIGYTGIESIQGSFYNVMGLPVEKLYVNLKRLFKK